MDITLVIFKENGQRVEFPLHKEMVTIGRELDCDLQIPLQSVSRRHCEMRLEGDSVLLKDSGSSNGTYHNSDRLTGEIAVSAGDHIRVGPVTFTVVIDEEPAHIKPVRTILGDLAVEPVRTIEEAKQADGRVDISVADAGHEEAASPANAVIETDDPLKALEALAREKSKK
jgi:pSer/pThr/pTyr-binding forkhead associated (FHA) protein